MENPNETQPKESPTAEEEINEMASNEGQGDTDDSGNGTVSHNDREAVHREIETNPTIFSTEENQNDNSTNQTEEEDTIPENEDNSNESGGSHSKINLGSIQNLGNQLFPSEMNNKSNDEPSQNDNEQNNPDQSKEIDPITENDQLNESANSHDSSNTKEIDDEVENDQNEEQPVDHQQENEISQPTIDQLPPENKADEEKVEILQAATNFLVDSLMKNEPHQNDDQKTIQNSLSNNEEDQQNEEETNQIQTNQENEGSLNKEKEDRQNTEETNQNEINQENNNPLNKEEETNQNEIDNEQLNKKDTTPQPNINLNTIEKDQVNPTDENEITNNKDSNIDDENEIKIGNNDVEQKVLGDDSTFFTSNKQFMEDSKQIHEPQQPKSKPRPRNSPKKVKLTPEEYHRLRIEKLKEYALEMYPLDDPSFETTDEEFEEIIRLLIEEKQQQVANRNFIEGNRINLVVIHVNQCYENKQKIALQKQEYQKYLEFVEVYEKQLQKFDKETETKMNELNKKNIASINELRKRHDNEIDEHYIKWMSDSKLRQYNRASQTLIHNRKILELLLNQNRLIEAQSLQNDILNLEKKEEQLAMKQRQHDYDESLKMLTDKQRNEEDFLIQKCEVKRNQLIRQRQVERSMFINKEKKIEAMKKEAEDPEKVWNSAQVQRINEIYKKKPGKDAARKRKINQNVVLPPMPENENDKIPRTARQPTTLTVLKLPPLKIKKPMRKSNTYAHSSR